MNRKLTLTALLALAISLLLCAFSLAETSELAPAAAEAPADESP